MYHRGGIIGIEYRDGKGERHHRADEREPGETECLYLLEDYSLVGNRDGDSYAWIDYRVGVVRDCAPE